MPLDVAEAERTRVAQPSISVLGTAFEHYRVGRLSLAEGVCRQVLLTAPNHADALYLLAAIAHQEGKLDDAITAYRKLLSVKPDLAEAHNDLGGVLVARGALEQAVASYQQALSLKPDYAEAHANLATALQCLGHLEEAVASYRKALSLRPDLAGIYYNLGNALKAQGKPDEAAAAYRDALSRRPEHAETWNNLGTVLRDLGRLDDAIASYRKALSLQSQYAAAHNNLGNVLDELGHADAALSSHVQALELEERPEFKANFAHCIRSIHWSSVDDDVRRLVTRAVAEAWTSPTDLAKTSARLVLSGRAVQECVERAQSAWPARLSSAELFGPSGPEVLAGDPLLRTLLACAPVAEMSLERLLTLVRHTLLEVTTGDGAGEFADEKTLALYCALAEQCFINEYIYSCTEEESARARSLRERLVAACQAGTEVPALWVAAVASYFPLHSLPHIGALLERNWPSPVAELLTQQIAEPSEEQRNRDAIPRLTTVEDPVSRLVQQQYEEHPYPRWVKAAAQPPFDSIDAHLRDLFPLAAFRPLNRGDGMSILCAGCGTGQESIEAARRFPGARVLAIDLSRASLGYAVRKTREAGLQNIDYAHADIMKLGALGRTFDVILSVGVLHHLADPVAGWKELVSLLRPGGFMRLGLYSELARRMILAARRLIVERGYAADAVDIRRLRETLMSPGADPEWAQLTGFTDFFVTSECRDLLFHVQEHRYTLLQIKEILQELRLNFIGFALDPRDARKYRARVPDDGAGIDLDRWHGFETEYPDTFRGMYQFWVQKA
jgi:tetratricopeptide (TPR) repeat protein/2-polyprenyl-3-methyl-5-hydroxy-6-metoxy-1,4-benzoquinol methylase